jgi:hypothetical protein
LPLDDLAEPLVRGVLRILWEIIFELLIRGAGYTIIKYGWYFGRKSPDPEGGACVVVGMVFWIGVVVAGIQMFRAFR